MQESPISAIGSYVVQWDEKADFYLKSVSMASPLKLLSIRPLVRLTDTSEALHGRSKPR